MSFSKRDTLVGAGALGLFVGVLVGAVTLDLWYGVLTFLVVFLGFSVGNAIEGRKREPRGQQETKPLNPDPSEAARQQRTTTILLLGIVGALAAAVLMVAGQRLGLW